MSLPRSTRANYDAKTLAKMVRFASANWLRLSWVNFDHPNPNDMRTFDEKYWDYVYWVMQRAEKEDMIASLQRELG